MAIFLGLAPNVVLEALGDPNEFLMVATALAGIYVANRILDWLRPSGKAGGATGRIDASKKILDV